MCVMRGLTKRKHSHPRNSGRYHLDIVDDKSVMDGDFLPETILPKANDAATPVFLGRTAEIDAALDRIRAASDDHIQTRGGALGPRDGHRRPSRADQADRGQDLRGGGGEVGNQCLRKHACDVSRLTDDRGFPILSIYSILDHISRSTRSGFRPV